MKKTFVKIGLGLLVLAGMAWPSRGDVTGMKTLPGHVPAAVAQLAQVNRLDTTNQMRLAIGLPLRNQEAAMTLLQQLYDRSSSNYRHYLTSDEFAAQFGPTVDDYRAVLEFAKTNGLIVEHTHPGRTLVDVVGSVSDVERAFHVNMVTYHHPTESRDFYAPDKEPAVRADLPILAVQGMDNFLLPHSAAHKKNIAAGSKPGVGSGPYGAYMGRDFRNAYLPGSSIDGTGQIVGLLQFDGYFLSDIQAYESIAGLTNVPLQNVLLDGYDGTPGSGNDEVCMDIELSMSMAPALAEIVVFEAGPQGIPDDVLSAMAENSQIKQFSSSWGYGVDATTHQFYLQFALQGQTYLNCSGDGDAWVGPILYGSVEDSLVTEVGGTTLKMNGTAASYASEEAWNWGFYGYYNWNPDGYFGTSGGTSTDVTIPWYQASIDMTTNLGSTTNRNVPDVALTGDNIFVVSSGGVEAVYGGTSAASPLWAGFMALVNEQAMGNRKPTIGFLAPSVYAIALSTNYAACFHDVTTGSNTWDQSTNKFFAVPGYDLCTGVGTPNGTNLINLLTGTNSIPLVAATPVIPAPKQPWGASLSVVDGVNPNGFWFLFFQDDTLNGRSGTNYNGWMINLTTANPVGFPADNELSINATNVVVSEGASWVTTLNVANYGPATSSNVYVLDQLPALSGVTLVSSNTSIPGSSIAVFGETLTWTIGTLSNNVSGTLNLKFSATNQPGLYTNGATVFSTTDPNPDDDSVGVSITVAPQGPLTISPAYLGASSRGFTLTVSNYTGAVAIQASTNLLLTNDWTTVFTGTAPFTFTNFDNTNFPYRFYRAVTAP